MEKDIEKLVEIQEQERSKNKAMDTEELLGELKFIVGNNRDSYLFHGNRNYSLNSEMLRALIQRAAKNKKGKYLSEKKISELVDRMKCQAQLEGTRKDIFIRSFRRDNTVYLDTGSETHGILRISSEGISGCPDASPEFFFPSNSTPMGISDTPCDVSDFKKMFNIKREEDFFLLIGAMLHVWFSNKPHLMVVFEGAQGCGKSTMTRRFKEIVDPSRPQHRSLPDREDNLFIAGTNTGLLAFDNLSGISNRMSDALCRILTGSSYASRTLYTNSEESFLECCRPIVVNGIESLSKRPDLADRSLFFFSDKIENIQSEEEQEKAFQKLLPGIRRYLLNLLQGVLKEMPTILTGKNSPRMVDFYKLLLSLEVVLGYSDFRISQAYVRNRKYSIDKMIEEDIVSYNIVKHIEKSDFLQVATDDLFDEVVQSLDEKERGFFPKRPRERGNQLARILPLIESRGYSVTPHRTNKRRGYIFRRNGDTNVTRNGVDND